MQGQLFTDYSLSDGIKATPEWRSLVSAHDEFEAFKDGIRELCDELRNLGHANEAVTEQEAILPLLELLGWTDYLPQQGAGRNEDMPDLLLFPNADAKARAIARESAEQRYRDGLVVVESKHVAHLIGPDQH